MPADIPWDRDELVLVLNLHRAHGAQPHAQHLSQLSHELRTLDFHPPEAQPANHRSPDAVGMKLQEFEALKSKTSSSRGQTALAAEVWAEFGRENARLWAEAKQIRERYAPPSDSA